jgi:hypothetical protein
MLVPFRFERRLSVTVDVRQMIDKNGLDVRQQRINYLHRDAAKKPRADLPAVGVNP